MSVGASLPPALTVQLMRPMFDAFSAGIEAARAAGQGEREFAAMLFSIEATFRNQAMDETLLAAVMAELRTAAGVAHAPALGLQ